MDGLSAGVAFICATTFLIAATMNGQWFVAALLLTFMGSVLGFLCCLWGEGLPQHDEASLIRLAFFF
jgi:hypothetical protein